MERETLLLDRLLQERALVEYKLVLNLSREIRLQLDEEKAYGLTTYGKAIQWFTQPMITVAGFCARRDMEETLLRWMHRICAQVERFELTCNNYGSLPGYPLFIRLADDGPVRRLGEQFRSLDGWLRSNGTGGVTVPAPRLQLVHSMEDSRSLEVLLDYSARTFASRGLVEEVLLVGQGQQIVSRLPLAMRLNFINE
ncbi:hypothetical protein [Flavihumibacter petaseus]|uniref:Uncharacterized protein n=1 Tax=Flavihumibacter petaseus NBRC 106054 TaxID=1220578 RepID=A0A0E9N6B6_9BACT|nr:hypothetical protein [Flavihumibacter petaseus]GAO45261.1 hypothetical protein FPE01S_04_05040 [Flavihumibacter petaseus NBRC 106054]